MALLGFGVLQRAQANTQLQKVDFFLFSSQEKRGMGDWWVMCLKISNLIEQIIIRKKGWWVWL